MTVAAPLSLDPEQREMVRAELLALTASLREPTSRKPYADLVQAIDEEAEEIAGDLVGVLQRLLEMSLASGRARRLHGADGEQALLRLFRDTPRGAAIRRTTDDANLALQALGGQVIRGLRFAPQVPGVYRLEIATDRCQLTLEVNAAGVTVDALGIEA
ncbi:MAG TPA: hypothetical protein VOA87_14560 [Thermoanaerobaculia bacterium]|nr:hypothetical protein [Thermoanaerobaculia bacterium]